METLKEKPIPLTLTIENAFRFIPFILQFRRQAGCIMIHRYRVTISANQKCLTYREPSRVWSSFKTTMTIQPHCHILLLLTNTVRLFIVSFAEDSGEDSAEP